jgi:hypothetical protein
VYDIRRQSKTSRRLQSELLVQADAHDVQSPLVEVLVTVLLPAGGKELFTPIQFHIGQLNVRAEFDLTFRLTEQ